MSVDFSDPGRLGFSDRYADGWRGGVHLEQLLPASVLQDLRSDAHKPFRSVTLLLIIIALLSRVPLILTLKLITHGLLLQLRQPMGY